MNETPAVLDPSSQVSGLTTRVYRPHQLIVTEPRHRTEGYLLRRHPVSRS
jgi:hypothetical protein